MLKSWSGGFLIAVLIAGCIYTGFRAFPIWILAPLGVASVLIFFIDNPHQVAFGIQERGPKIILMQFVTGVVLCAIPFTVGRVLGAM